MVVQINLRMNDNLHSNIKEYSEQFGYENMQDFIREVIREKVFESNNLTKKEIEYAKLIEKLSDNKDDYGSIKDIKTLIKKKKKQNE